MLKKVTLKDLDSIDSIEKTCFPSQEAASKDSLKERLEVYPEGFYLYYVDETPIGYIGGLKNNQCELPDEMYEMLLCISQMVTINLIFSWSVSCRIIVLRDMQERWLKNMFL